MQTILVAAAVIVEDGRVLLTQRKPGAHLEGKWEFPGGKVEPGEDPRDALRRELREELGIETTVGDIVEVTFHRYSDGESAQSADRSTPEEKTVLLLFFEAARAADSPEMQALEVAAIEWATRERLDPARFPAADVAVLRKVAARLR